MTFTRSSTTLKTTFTL